MNPCPPHWHQGAAVCGAGFGEMGESPGDCASSAAADEAVVAVAGHGGRGVLGCSETRQSVVAQ